MRDSRTTPWWRIAATLLGLVAAVLALIWLPAACVDRTTRAPEPQVEDSRTADETRSTVPATMAPSATATPEPTQSVPATPVPSPPPAPSRGVVPAIPQGSVIVIDAGHQAKGNSTPEPIGPGSDQKKASTTSGTSGVVTRVPEGKLTLEVALKLRDELQKRGARVVMVRTSQNVDMTNRERAEIANRENADLFIRLHADGSTDRDRRGISTLVPASNQWTRPIVPESRKAGSAVHKAVVAAAGAPDLGVVPRGDLTGFNWAKVPTVLVEMGFMSNPVEDRLLATDAYQVKLVRGMADGIAEYLGAR